VVPWKRLDTALIPGGGELRLMQRGREFSIMLGQTELMNSRISGSEEALAALACKRIGHDEGPEVLIGGLGMGFTLRAALSELGPNARVVVAELVPAVVRWARGPMAELFGSSLADRRVILLEADVASVMKRSKSAYAAILLDVDNGPNFLSGLSGPRKSGRR
jgi:spermidine synthase